MKKLLRITAIVSIILMTTMLTAHIVDAAPQIKRPYEIIEATIDGGNPVTIDPAACYDTASGELLFNMYDTLIFFNGEHLDQYLPSLATSWTIENITGTTSPEGLNWYFRYTFKIRTGVKFWDGSTVTPADIEYDFERMMVTDYGGGPQWMFFEPLLNGAAANFINQQDYNLSLTSDVITVGKMIDHSVESNATHVWLNLAFPGAYGPLLQILGQPWASIYPKAWANGLGRATNWPGDWGDYTGWKTYWNPATPPFDDPTPVAMGSGPFMFETWDNTLKQWSVNRNTNYWRGWPADYPALAGASPKGYINHFVCTWAYDWASRQTLFMNGDVDYCAVPRANMNEVLGKPGIRCMYPLPNLAVDAIFYEEKISKSSPYGTINDAGVFTEGGIPTDFFGNPTWGVYCRKAVSSVFDYKSYIQAAYLGEASTPATAVIPGLAYYDSSIKGYTYNTTFATEMFKKVPGLWDTGFTMPLAYNSGNIPRQTAANLIKAGVEALNPKFHVTVQVLSWGGYSANWRAGYLPAFLVGWLLDYPDPHDFTSPFYYSIGSAYAAPSHYSNPVMDALVLKGVATPDGPERAAIYTQIQQLAIDDCPNVPIAQAIGRHFERDWIVGWYYNLGYSGAFLYNVWKWYYVPQAGFGSVTDAGYSSNLPADVNYDGKVNIQDIAAVAGSFGASYGPPINARWTFRADIDNNRNINIVDITAVARQWQKTSAVWVPPT